MYIELLTLFLQISSQGVVHTLGGARPLKKRQLMREDAAMSDSVYVKFYTVMI